MSATTTVAARPNVPSVTHLAWSRSLPPSQWASLIHQLAQKETLPPAAIEQAVLDALVPPPTAYHASLLSAALTSTPTHLVSPQALLLRALSSQLDTAPPSSVWTLLQPYASLLALPASHASRLVDLLSTDTSRSPALMTLAARLISHSGLPATLALPTATLLASLKASPTGQPTTDLQVALETAATQMQLAGGSMPPPSVAASATVKGGLEERVLGALETDVQSMMKDPSAVADHEEGAEVKLAEIVHDALAAHAPLDRQALLQSTLEQLEPQVQGGRDELVRELFIAGIARLASDGDKASRTLLVGQLPTFLPAVALADASATIQALFAMPEVNALFDRIDKAALSASAKAQSSSRMEGVEEEHEGGMHEGEENHDENQQQGADLPPIKLDLLEACLTTGLLSADEVQALGFPSGEGSVRHSALAEGEMLGFSDTTAYWTHVCGGATSSFDRQTALAIRRVCALDWSSQQSLSDVFFATWRAACAEKDIGLLASLCETLLSKDTKGVLSLLLEWGAGREAAREMTRVGIDFLETFDGEGYGDSQSTLLQYAQISTYLQLLVRQQSLERTKLGSVNGRQVSAAFFGQASMVYPLESLGDDEKELLAGWVTALFGSEGIADDLLQSTAPRTLLKLATTLVSQALSAFQRKVVDLERVKVGLSYFSQPFLAWQLSGVVSWLVREIRRVGSRGGAHLMVLEGLLMETGCPSTVIELHGQSVLDLLDEPATKSMPGGAIDAEAIRQLVATTLGPAPRAAVSVAGQPSAPSWVATLDAFADHYLSPSTASVRSASAPPLTSLPTLVIRLGPSTVVSSLWTALTSAPISPPSGAIDRFAALLALYPHRDGDLLETFLVQFAPQAQAILPDARLPTLDEAIRRVIGLALVSPRGQELVQPLLQALKCELSGVKFAARQGVRGERRTVLAAVEKATAAAVAA